MSFTSLTRVVKSRVTDLKAESNFSRIFSCSTVAWEIISMASVSETSPASFYNLHHKSQRLEEREKNSRAIESETEQRCDCDWQSFLTLSIQTRGFMLELFGRYYVSLHTSAESTFMLCLLLVVQRSWLAFFLLSSPLLLLPFMCSMYLFITLLNYFSILHDGCMTADYGNRD